MPKLPVIAIDGPSASGKGTLARRLAGHFGLAYLDTGRLYRGTGLAILSRGGDPADPETARAAARSLDANALATADLRSEAVGQAASIVAADPGVRAALLDFQRNFTRHPPALPDGPARGVVLDGRDIGTVVAPDAAAKLFVTAEMTARAERRAKELRGAEWKSIYGHVLQDMEERDRRDSQRQAAPLMPAPGAIVLDTTHLDADAAFALAAEYVARMTGLGG